MRNFLQALFTIGIAATLSACGGAAQSPCAQASDHFSQCTGVSPSSSSCDPAAAEAVLARSCDELAQLVPPDQGKADAADGTAVAMANASSWGIDWCYWFPSRCSGADPDAPVTRTLRVVWEYDGAPDELTLTVWPIRKTYTFSVDSDGGSVDVELDRGVTGNNLALKDSAGHRLQILGGSGWKTAINLSAKLDSPRLRIQR